MKEDEVELNDYFRVVWKRKILIIVITLVSVVAGVIMSLRSPETYIADALLKIGRKVAHSFASSTHTPPSFVFQHIETPLNLVASIPRLYCAQNNGGSEHDLEVKMMSKDSLIKITIKGFDKKRVEGSLRGVVNRIIDDHSRETEDSTQYLYALVEGLDKELKKAQGERDKWESELDKIEEKMKKGMEEEVEEEMEEEMNIEEVDPLVLFMGQKNRMSVEGIRRMFLQINLEKTISNIKDVNVNIRSTSEKLFVYRTFADSVKNYKTRLIGDIRTSTMKLRRKRNVLMAGTAGLMISLFLSFFIEYLRKETEGEK